MHAQSRLQLVVIGFSAGILLENVNRSRGVAKNSRYRKITSRNTKAQVAAINCCLVWLVDVEEAPEPVTLRAHVTHLQRHFTSDLLLDVQVVILHVGSLYLLVDRENVALRAATTGRRSINRGIGLERPGGQGKHGLLNRVRSNIVICRPGSIEGRKGQMAQEHIL